MFAPFIYSKNSMATTPLWGSPQTSPILTGSDDIALRTGSTMPALGYPFIAARGLHWSFASYQNVLNTCLARTSSAYSISRKSFKSVSCDLNLKPFISLNVYYSCVSSVGLEAVDQLLYCYMLSCCVQDKLVNEQAERRPAACSARSDWLKQGCQLAQLDGLSSN